MSHVNNDDTRQYVEMSQELHKQKFSGRKKRSLPTEELRKVFREEVAFQLDLGAWYNFRKQK